MPLTISLNRSGFDYCTTAPKLESQGSRRQFGWHPGDISYVGGWLSIFHSGQNRLPMPIMVLGNIDESDISKIKTLPSSITVKFEIE